MKKIRNLKLLMLLLTLVMVTCLWPAKVLSAAPATATVKIIGTNSVILNTEVNISDVTDYTTDANDTSSDINALDAVIYATLQNGNGFANDSYSISYNSTYGSYFLSKLAGISPAGSDYWGTLAINSSGDYDGNPLNTHALAAGDTYIVYYDKYTGAATNYGYQSYAGFKEDMVSGTTYSVTTVEPITTGYDANWNIAPTALPGITIYATGPNLVAATPIAVTDSSGKAYITFPEAGQYILTLSSDYIYTQCDVTITGSSVTLNDVSINVTDGTDNLSNALLTLTGSPGNSPHSPYEVTGGTHKYRLTDGTYKYSASLSGYEPVIGTLTVSGAASQNVVLTARADYEVSITPADSTNETVIVKNGSGIVQPPISVASGVYTYNLADGNYNYSINRSGYHSSFGSFTVNGAGQAINTSALTDTGAGSAEWSAFRDFSDNMATVTFPTAQGSWQTEEKWATSLGALGSWGTLPTSNIILYDGYLYVATEHGLSKIDKSDGTLLTTTALSTGASYAAQIAYGNGKIFVTTTSGIDAFDALTMERLWSALISPWGNYMAATPILYDDTAKTIYIGDYGDSNYTLGTYGGYSCLDANNGSSQWIMYGAETDARYWAGAVMVGDYVVFGSDSGTLTSVKTDASGNASATSTLAVTGKINSAIAYDSTHLYFTTKSGYIYKVSIDNTGQLLNVASRQFSTGSSSTPVVYNGRVYVGASDGIYVLKADDLTQIAYYKTSAVQSSALLTTAYGGTVYVYFTVNSPQSEIVVLADDGTNTTYDTLFIPMHSQYSLTSLIADSEGTLYSTNDSGYVYAIENNKASKTDKVKLTISVSPASLFDSTTWTTTYPSIIVKDSGGAMVSTAVSGTYYLGTGSYSYTVSLSGYNTAKGSFDVTGDDISNGSQTIPVTLTASSSGDTPTTITVTVTVIGDSKHGNNEHTAYQTWVNSKSVAISSGSTAWDAIKNVLDSSGLSYVLTDNSLGKYIYSVNGLAEMDNGPNSGWMYSVNGTDATVGVSSYTVKAGDSIILYYTDNYQQNGWEGGSPPGNLPGASPSPAAGVILTGTLDKSTGIASVTLSNSDLDNLNQAITASAAGKSSGVTLTVTTPAGANALNLVLPPAPLTALSQQDNTSLSIKSELGNLTFDAKAIAAISSAAGSAGVTISIAQVNGFALSSEAQAIVGDRPVYDFSLKTGETKISNFGGGTANISIPYTLATGENENAIVVYYIDASGSLQMVRGAYNSITKTVDFVAAHFSKYAVGYNKIVFVDVTDSSWYSDAVTFCAARGITTGIGNGRFGPEDTLTRGQFIVMLMRAYGIEPDKNPAKNFTDAGEGYYTNYLAAAKRLGIAQGVGDNQFAPNSKISRQDMFTLLYRALDVLGELPTTKTSNTLSSYSDTGEVSDYAMTALKLLAENGIVSGSDGKINPGGGSTRAQMVQILYNILSRYV